MKKRKAIFFDRDGIVNVKLENDYVKNFDEFVFRKHFLNLFSLIKSKGYLAILVTNQQCVDKGIIDEKELVNIHNLMQEQIF
jgi:D-glycero-D-manno-heptose 1,7-bisphosphate phosphatase